MRRSEPVNLLGETISIDPVSPLVIATGHQPEFMHPGVWAKNVAATWVAEGIGGRALFLVVDSDVAAEAVLRWPQERDGRLVAVGRALPGAVAGRSFEQLDSLAADDWRNWFAEVASGFRADSSRVFGDFERAFTEVPVADSYVSRWTSGLRAIDRRVGVASPHVSRVSELTSGPHAKAWTRFVAHLLMNARAFAASYNGSLAAYRLARRIRGARHPIPDLHIDSSLCETPFWLAGKLDQRKRLVVRDDVGGRIALTLGDGPSVAIARDELLRTPEIWRDAIDPLGNLRPRALALTMFARLFACDCFIHGLGGAKYDQITDGIVRAFFGVQPPAYACVTATLRLELRRTDVSIEQLRGVRWEVRDRRFNPQRYLVDGTPLELVNERNAAISESNTLRESAAYDHDRRRRAFERIARGNRALADFLLPGPDAARLTDLAFELAEKNVADGREWFAGLHPTVRLGMLRDKIRETAGTRD